MENYNKNDMNKPAGTDASASSNVSGRIFSGLIVVAIGVVLLANRLDANLPSWLLSWEMLLIAIGVFVGVRHQFRGPGWLIMIAIGTVFLVDDILDDVAIKNFLWPIVIIAVGLIIMLKPSRKGGSRWESSGPEQTSSERELDSVTIFGGLKKNIISKDFKGGEITTIMGGTELNLTQADFQGRVVLEMTQIFGGTKLIIPPHWKVESGELVNIFGGLDDKRPMQIDGKYDDNKILVIKGTCLFGGLDLRSF